MTDFFDFSDLYIIQQLIFDKKGAVSPHEAFFYFHVNQLRAVRSGPWKLYLPTNEIAELQLFNLRDDLLETRNLAAKRTDVVARLLDLLKKAREDLGELDQRGANVRPVGTVDNPVPRVLVQEE